MTSLGSFSSENAIDGNLATDWTPARGSQGDGAYWQLGLINVEPSSIASIRWQPTVNGFVDVITVQVSTDGMTWHTVTKPSGSSVGDWQEVDVGEYDVHYVRFEFHSPNDEDPFDGLAEVEIIPK